MSTQGAGDGVAVGAGIARRETEIRFVMRTVIAVLAAVFLGLLVAIAVRPLLVPPIPAPLPAVSLPAPPTIPPAGNRPAQRPATETQADRSPALAARPNPPAPIILSQAPARPSPTSRRRPAVPTAQHLSIVQVALAPTRDEAARLAATLRAAGFEPYVVPLGERFAVRLGAFRDRTRAERLARLARSRGFPAAVIRSP